MMMTSEMLGSSDTGFLFFYCSKLVLVKRSLTKALDELRGVTKNNDSQEGGA